MCRDLKYERAILDEDELESEEENRKTYVFAWISNQAVEFVVNG